MNKQAASVLVAGIGLLFSLPTAAQQKMPGVVPAADKTFMIKAAQGGMSEVVLGQLSQSHGRSAEAKNFGRQMVNDHTKANGQLKQAAAKQGITLPSAPGPNEQATKTRLAGLSGTAFDKAYISDMVEDHKKDVADFKKEAATGKNPAVMAFAVKTLPTLQMHLPMARTLNISMNNKKV